MKAIGFRLLVAVVAVVVFASIPPADAAARPGHGQSAAGTHQSGIPEEDFDDGLRLYRGYVGRQIAVLRTQVHAIATDASADRLADAEGDWLVAHSTWLSIGQDNGQYGAFGVLGEKIDGTAAGLRRGTSSERFMGLHKVEFDLWTRGDLASATIDCQRLEDTLTTLAATPMSTWFHVNKADVADWILRSHEIIEDAIRDSLSGEDNYGSGNDVASIVTDSAAAHLIVKLLRPDLDQYAPGLYQRSSRALRHLRALGRSTRQAGAWVALDALSRRQREQLNAAAGHAAEVLAAIPVALHLSNT